MFAIIIQEKGGEQRRQVFDKPEVTIGRVQGNDIVLPKGNVSKRHARIVLKDGKFIIVDLKSTNGTYVNGRKITSPLVVKESDKIYIGDFIMGVDESGAGGEAAAGVPEAPRFDPGPPTPAGQPPRFEPPGARAEAAAAGLPAAPPPPHSSGASPELLRAALARQEPPRPAPLGDPATERPPAAAMRGADAPPPPSFAERGRPGGPPDAVPGLGFPERPPGGPSARAPGADRGGPDGASPPALGDRPRGDGAGIAPPRPVPPLPGPSGFSPPRPGGADGGAPAPREPVPPPPARDAVAQAAPVTAERVRVPRPGPGGTMPPPAGPAIPPTPVSPPAAAASALGASPVGAAPIAAPPVGAGVGVAAAVPAPVTPIGDRAAAVAAAAPKPRPVPAPARRVAPRPVSAPLRRGVHLEPLDAKIIKLLDLQTQILERLRAKLDLDNLPIERLGEEDLWQKAERAIVDLVETLDSSGELPKYIEQDTLIKETLNEALGLGPLEDLLADDKVDEIIVDRRDRIVVGKDGQLRGAGKAFSSDEVLRKVVERLVAPTGHVIGDDSPLVDVRLRDGSRLTAAVPPVATQGACLVLRKPRGIAQTVADLVAAGGMSSEMGDFLSTCIAARRNLLVTGGSSSGKSQLVAALAGSAPAGERVVTVEEVAEITLKREEWIALETRPGDARTASVDLGQLVRGALRLRPDRLVIGDIRGSEAFELITALGSSIDGAVVAIGADGSAAALNRVAALARMALPEAAESVIREMVASAFDIVVHVARSADGTMRVVAIEEVLGLREGGAGFETQPVFAWKGPGDEAGFGATGAVPRFYTELEGKGIAGDVAIFKA